MPRERKTPKDDKPIIPMHFQTWGDMMMNMLTLFILLCSFANERQAAFFAAGIGSFINAVESYGLPGLMPADTKPIMLDAYDDRFKAPMEKGSPQDQDSTSYDTMDQVDLETLSIEGEVWLPDAIYFPRGSARLGNKEKTWLRDEMSVFMRSDYEIEVTGHAWLECSDRSAARRLSLRRAYAVITYLNEACGLPLESLHAVAFGESRPLVVGENDPGLNRRVNFKLTKSR